METTTTPDPLQNLINTILEDKPVAPTQQMVVRESATIGVKVSELRAIIQRNPDHPKSQTFRLATADHRGGDTVFVEKIDLEAIIRNRNVTTVVSTEKHVNPESGVESSVPVERKFLDT